jgi:mannose-1-phosphate guanylyltransferase
MSDSPGIGRAANWAVILAGGDGTRLRELSYAVSGEWRLKQFCSFFGGKSLLTHTRERISPLFPEEKTLFVLNRAHEVHYRGNCGRSHPAEHW